MSSRGICVCEVVARGQGASVVLAEETDAVGEHLLMEGGGLGDASRLLVRVCEVVARGQGASVVLAEEMDAVGEDLLEQGDRLGDVSRLLIRACDGSRTLHVFKI